MTTPNNTVAGLAEKLTKLVTRLRDGDWNMRTPQELAEAVADAIMEALASPAPSAGVGCRCGNCEVCDGREAIAALQHPAAPSVSPAVYQCPNCGTGMEVDPTAKPSPSVAGDAGQLPEVEGLTPKQAWWAGARAALGLPADTPRIEVARRLATAEQPGSAVQGEAVATLHADGYWTWKGTPPHESNYAGWRMDVFASPPPAPAAEQDISDAVMQADGECPTCHQSLHVATQPDARGVEGMGELTFGQRAVAEELLRCCESWEPNVCVMGNVRAKDAADLLRLMLAAPSGVRVDGMVSLTAIKEVLQPLTDGRSTHNVHTRQVARDILQRIAALSANEVSRG